MSFVRQRQDYQSIKLPLKSVVKNQNFVEEIRNIVLRINKAQDDAYLFSNYYVREKFKKNEILPKIDYKFIQYIFGVMGFCNNPGKSKTDIKLLKDLTKYYDIYRLETNHKKNNLDLLLNPQLNSYVTKEMLTKIGNNISKHYIKRLTKYINIVGGEIYDQCNLDPKKKQSTLINLRNNIINYEPVDPLFQQWFNEKINDQIIPPKKDDINLSYDLKKNPLDYFNSTVKILSYFEQYNDQIKIEKDNDPYYQLVQVAYRELDKLKGKDKTDKKKEIRELKKKSVTYQSNKRQIKLFAILPHPSFEVKHVTFDSTSLVKLFFPNRTKAKFLKKLPYRKRTIWSRFFFIKKKCFRKLGYDFHFIVKTDGTSCSIIFKKQNIRRGTSVPSEQEDEFIYVDDMTAQQINQYPNLVFGDPGKQSLFLMDEKDQKFQYTNKFRMFQIRSDRYEKIQKIEKDKNQQEAQDKGTISVREAEAELAKHCSKSLNNYNDYLRTRSRLESILSPYYQRKIWQKWSLRKYINKQRHEMGLLNTLEQKFGKESLFIIGDWSKTDTNRLKNGRPTMGKGLLRLLSKRFHTVLIDEFRTSVTCSQCIHQTVPIYIGTKYIHRLRGCENCYDPDNLQFRSTGSINDEKVKFIHRDRNAVINMQTIVACIANGDGRPAVFCRSN